MRRRFGTSALREIAIIVVPLCLAIAGVVWLASRFVDPPPPSTFVISTASKGSPYYRFAERYAPVFARNGITLEIRESEGSIANIQAMQASPDVSAGFVQGGLFTQQSAPGLQSLGRIAHEPLWVFHSDRIQVTRLTDLIGKRVLIGPAGGGTSGLALRLLAANGVTGENATLLNSELPDYVDALANGRADAGFLVLAAEARTIQRLFQSPGVKLMSFTNADAYTQKFAFLSKLELNEGAIDLGRKIPPDNTTLLATTAAVVVRDDAHPALVSLLAQAVHETHSAPIRDASGQASLFQRAGEFPTAADPEFPMTDEARRVYRNGPPFLQRYVPFWLASTIDRLLVSMLVLVPLVVPVAKLAPQLYRWRMRRRILYWYGVLKRLEGQSRTLTTTAERTRSLAELDNIEAAVDLVPIPLGFADQLYELRQNIDAVRARLSSRPTRSLQ